jgi:hypothetical protein
VTGARRPLSVVALELAELQQHLRIDTLVHGAIISPAKLP